MVTAGHSLIGTGAVSVCFDDGPISYAIQDGQVIYYGADTIYTGTPVTVSTIHPSIFRQPRIRNQRHRPNNTRPNQLQA